MALPADGSGSVYDEMVRRDERAVPPGQVAITDREFNELRQFIHAHTGIALSDHKRALVCSRLGKRLRAHGFKQYADYYQLLAENDPEEVELGEMINAITTNKTDFFREPHHFKFLADELFPALRARTGERRLRLWSAASSSGEEPYSLAITAFESFPDINNWDLKILATDIDTNMLARGENGVYNADHAARIPEPLRKRYLLRGQGELGGRFMIKPELQSIVRFRRLNLMDNPWPMRGLFDVIFCRNVIIYFDKATQRTLIDRLAHQLKPGGYLMLGHSESLHGISTRFEFINHSIYRFSGNR